MLAVALAELPGWLWVGYAALVGLCVGSFLNVLAYRLPRGRSLLGRSACPACDHPIRWADNVPVLSFIALRGRCRHCRSRIPWRYPAVEAAAGGFWAVAAWRLGPTPAAIMTALFASALLVLALIDVDHMALPDTLTLPLIALGLGAAVLGWGPSALDAVGAAAAAGGFFAAVVLVTRALGMGVAAQAAAQRTAPSGSARRPGADGEAEDAGLSGGMGTGDVILAAALGAHLGLWRTALAVWLAALLGGAVAAWLLASRRVRVGQPIPYGPFLAAGGIVVALFVP